MRGQLLLLAAMIFVVIFARFLAPYDPMLTDSTALLQPPGRTHLLGTDLLGRDVLSRVLYGGQRTLLTAVLATVTAICPGVLIGLLVGIYQGWVDKVLAVLLNAVLAFPGLVLALVILTLVGVGILPLALAVGGTQIAPFARVTRAAVMTVLSMEYVQAAEALGATRWQVVIRHILPNIQPTLITLSLVVFSYSILNGAALSFLGLGGEPGVPDWGVMLAEGRAAFRAAPWISFAPGVAITVTILMLSNMADWLAARNG
jgi:ABC-type dipeptide/oligopeptide/nickel transport system permease subunit